MGNKIREIANMTDDAVNREIALRNITVSAGATADEKRKLLVKHGGFGWNWTIGDIVAALVFIVAAGFVTPKVTNTAVVLVLVGIAFLVADVVRTHKANRTAPNYGFKAFLGQNLLEVIAVVLVVAGLMLASNWLIIGAALVALIEFGREKWL